VALRERQDRFVAEYLIDLDPAAAYRRAGYEPRSDKAARNAASRLLANVGVQEAIAERRQRQQERLEIKSDDIVRELKRVGFSKMDQFARWGPDGVVLIDSALLTPDAAACVAEVSQTITQGGGSIKFKLHSKTAALELLGKHLGLFKDISEHRFPDGIPLSSEDVEAGRRLAEAYRQRRLAGVPNNGTADNQQTQEG
jgi:phage terminase small subunit